MVFIKHKSLKSDIFFNPIFISCFSGSKFFRVQVFLGSGFTRFKFIWVQVFQSPGFKGPCFSGFRFLRVQVFHGPGFSRIFRVKVFQGTGFLESRVFWVHVFQGLDFSGSRFFRAQIFQGIGFSESRCFGVQVFQGSCSGSRSKFQKQPKLMGYNNYVIYVIAKEKKNIYLKLRIVFSFNDIVVTMFDFTIS